MGFNKDSESRIVLRWDFDTNSVKHMV